MDAFDPEAVIDWKPPETGAEAREAKRVEEAREEDERFVDFIMWLVLEAKRNREQPGSTPFDLEDGAAFLQRMERYRKEQDAEWNWVTRAS
jgi:hypothetical protein